MAKLPGSYWADFASLLFPGLCQACGRSLVAGGDLLRPDCCHSLPFTNSLKADNMTVQQSWTKINLAMCYLFQVSFH